MRTRPFVFASLLACLSVAAAAAAADIGNNLLRNPGFEDGAKRPTDWTFAWKYTHSNDLQRGVEKQEPDWAWDAETVHSGKRSLRMGVKRPQDDAVWTQDNVSHVTGTKIYLVRAWIKTDGVEKTRLTIGCVSLAAGGKWLGAGYRVVSAGGTRDWTQYTGYFQPHPKAVTFRVRLWLNMNYSGTGTAWIDDVEVRSTDMETLPPIRYVDDTPMPSPSDEDKQAGYVLFEKNALEMVFPNTVPRKHELGATLRMFASPGEYEPRTFCIRSLRDLGTVTVKVDTLASGGAQASGGREPAVNRRKPGAHTPGSPTVRVNPVKCLIQHGQARWGDFAEGDMLVPVIVEETDTTTVPAETTRQFWVTVKVPKNAKPGTYRGNVTVTPEHGEARQVAVEVEVLPIRLLEPPHIAFGMYARFRPELDFTRAAFRDMREHGMTTIGLCTKLGARMEMDGSRVKVTLDGASDLEQAVAAYRRAGFTMPIPWLMSRDVLNFCLRQGDLDSKAFESCYRQVIAAIVDHGKKQGWPEILFQPIDEPYEHANRPIFRNKPESPTVLETTRRCLQIIKTIPGVRTEEDGANGAPHNLEELYKWVDVEVYHDGPVLQRGTYDAQGWATFLERLKRDGKEIWFYNIDITGWHPEPLRFGYGFGLYQARGTGMIEWAYMFGYSAEKPNRLYVSKLPLAYRYNRTATEPGGPTTAWEAAREGVDDYKYLYTLLELTKRLKAEGKAALAEQAENDVLGRIARIDFNGSTGSACQGRWTGRIGHLPTGEKFVSGAYKMANGLTFTDYTTLRRAIADWIIKLKGTRP